MRFKVSMIRQLIDSHEETVMANKEKQGKWNVHIFCPQSKVKKAKWLYK